MPVTLRPFTPAGITDQHLACLNDKHRMRFSNQRFHDHTFDSCLAYLAGFDEGRTCSYLSIRNDEDRVGTLTIYRNLNHGTADIGIMTYGGGYGLEAWQEAMKLLEAERIRKITAGTLATNYRMIDIMRACHMWQEAVRHGQELCEGEPVDVTYWAYFPRPTLVESDQRNA